MMRKVYLEGEIGFKYGKVFDMNVSSISEVFRVLQANFEDVKHYLVECERKNISFSFQVANKSLNSEEDLILPLDDGDILISAVPAGSKSGESKLFAALLIAASFMIPGAQGATGFLVEAGSLTIPGQIAASIGINLALTGIQQLMAPDPSTDSDEPASYLFDGSNQNSVEGDPVPILYGELKVPGKPINFGVISSRRSHVANNYSSGGNNVSGDRGDGHTGTVTVVRE